MEPSMYTLQCTPCWLLTPFFWRGVEDQGLETASAYSSFLGFFAHLETLERKHPTASFVSKIDLINPFDFAPRRRPA